METYDFETCISVGLDGSVAMALGVEGATGKAVVVAKRAGLTSVDSSDGGRGKQESAREVHVVLCCCCCCCRCVVL